MDIYSGPVLFIGFIIGFLIGIIFVIYMINNRNF